MSQYINLLGPAFRKPKLLLTLNRSAGLLALLLAGLTLLWAYDRQRVAGLREELASAQGLLKAQSVYTARLKGDAAQTGGGVLDTDIQRLEIELKSARESMGVLEGGALGNREGFARYMLAFSRQALDGLWLTGFSVGGGGEVSITGRVTRAELVPAYIQRLNGEPVLKGRAFSALELRRPPLPVAPADPGKPASEERAPPSFLEFALATREPVAEGTGARAERR